MNWHYVEQGQPTGPVSDEQLAELNRTGKVNADTPVWHEGMADWLPFNQVSLELKPSGPVPGPGGTAAAAPPVAAGNASEAVCNECGKIFPIDEMIPHGNTRICSGCKPVFMQKLSEGAKINTGELNYAGFGIRFGAKLLDGLILGVPFMLVYFLVMFPLLASQAGERTSGKVTFLPILLQLLLQFGIIAVQVAFQTFFLGKYGATPGKMVCKLKVVTATGDKISYGRAAGRALAEMLSGMICYIGYFMVAFDNPQRRALHDHICNTRVIYK